MITEPEEPDNVNWENTHFTDNTRKWRRVGSFCCLLIYLILTFVGVTAMYLLRPNVYTDVCPVQKLSKATIELSAMKALDNYDFYKSCYCTSNSESVINGADKDLCATEFKRATYSFYINQFGLPLWIFLINWRIQARIISTVAW